MMTAQLSDHLLTIAWTWIWQVTLLAGIVSFIGWCLRYRAPKLMYALWIIVMIKCLVPPIVKSPFAWTTPAVSAIGDRSASHDAPVARKPSASTAIAIDHYKIDLPLKAIAKSESPTPTPHGPAMPTSPSIQATESTPTGISSPVESQSTKTLSLHWPTLLLTAWLTGWLTSMIRMRVRVQRFRKRIHSHSVGAPSWLIEVIDDTRQQLNIHRSVNVVVSDAVNSPMIMGVIRPTIHLPAHLVDDPLQRDSLDVVVAHELIHLKRGDLLLGWLQQLVKPLWWFHPLVWFASRQLSLQCELLCDRAVLRHLGCAPSNYAHRLLAVLQTATQTDASSLPHSIAPGMSAFGRTQLRMERIMKTNPKSKNRWDVLVVLATLAFAVAVLPGKLTATAQDDLKLPSVHAKDDSPSQDAKTKEENNEPNQTRRLKRYPNIIIRTQLPGDTSRLSQSDFAERLVDFIRKRSGGSSDAEHLRLSWHGDELQVIANHDEQELIAEYFAGLDLSNAPQIAIEFVIADVDHKDINDLFQAIGMEWYAMVDSPASLSAHSSKQPTKADTHLATWSPSVQHARTNATPLLISFIRPAVKRALVNLINDRPRLSIVQAPKVTMFDGQKAMVTNGSTTPFTTAFQRNENDQYEPKVQMIPEGLGIELMPKMLNRDTVHVKLWQKRTKVLSVSTFRLASRISSPDLQTPQLLTRRFAADLTMREGDTALVAWIEPIDGNQPKVHLTMMTPNVILNADRIKTSDGVIALPTDNDKSAMKYGLLPLTEFPTADAVGAEEQKDVSEWKKSPLSPLPLTRELLETLTRFSAELTTDNLTSYSVNDDKSISVAGDSVTLTMQDECAILFAEMRSCSITSKSMKIAVDGNDLELQFESPIAIVGDQESDCRVVGDRGTVTIGHTSEAPIPQIAINLMGNAKLDFDEFNIIADRFDGTFDSYTAEGNVTMTASLDGKKERTLKGSKLSVSDDFPVFVIER